jgi:hypothetical protein
MGTRSTIALEFADGSVGQVYCHWDGYLDHNGRILNDHYSDPIKLRNLIDLGDLSSLGPEIGDKHEFDCPYKYGTPEAKAWHEQNHKVCTFYGRDRGETDTQVRMFKDYMDYHKNADSQEYNYILRRDGIWYVKSSHFSGPLSQAFEEFDE